MTLTKRYQDRSYAERPCTDDEMLERMATAKELATKYPWLAEEVAAVTEAAYRRGYQQGHFKGTDAGEIADWRFCPFGDYFRYRTAVTPPGGTDRERPAIDRLRIEANNASNVIGALVRQTLFGRKNAHKQ
jgi:hypothetical protein